MPTGYSNTTGLNPFKGQKRPAFSKEHCIKISLSSKGKIPWNKGLTGLPKHSKETRLKMSEAHSNEKHHEWKGEDVGYSALHSWISRKKGSAKNYYCSVCRTKKSLQWANKDHKYKRKLSDWIVLCSKCHYKYDEVNLKTLHGYNRKKK